MAVVRMQDCWETIVDTMLFLAFYIQQESQWWLILGVTGNDIIKGFILYITLQVRLVYQFKWVCTCTCTCICKYRSMCGFLKSKKWGFVKLWVSHLKMSMLIQCLKYWKWLFLYTVKMSPNSTKIQNVHVTRPIYKINVAVK